ncbi:MAG: Ger(x)C family spore germination protein [Paenibacillus sp.]|nr:Ger(x)C family spore germination protein [Paenibacillus sp.]
MHRIFKPILPILLLASLLSGCWERVEVNDIAIVTATGIDLMDDNNIRVSLLFAVPRLVGTSSVNGGGGDSQLEATAGWVVSEQGKTIMDAYRNIQGKLPRKIFFSHNRVIVIGQKLARKGVMPILDFFERNRQSQLNSYLMVSKTEAADVLNFKPKFEKMASEIMKEEMKVGTGTSIRLGRFLTMILDEGQEPYAPTILMVPSEKKQSESEKTTNLMASNETSVFLGDRLIGGLNEKETRGLMWLRNEIKEGVITITIPQKYGGGNISAELGKSRSKIIPVERNGKIQMKLDFSTSIHVSENTSKLDLSSDQSRTLLKTLFTDDIKKRIEMVCTKVQKELGTDILGFGQTVYQNNPKKWNTVYAKKWKEVFPDVKVDIKASVQIIGTGLIGKDVNKEDR